MSGSTAGIGRIQVGTRFQPGAVFDNYTFRIGVKKITAQLYNGWLLEIYLPALESCAMYYSGRPPLVRNNDGSLVFGFNKNTITITNKSAGYIRLTNTTVFKELTSGMVTGDAVAAVGKNVKFSVEMLHLPTPTFSTDSRLAFGVLYADGTMAAELAIVDSGALTDVFTDGHAEVTFQTTQVVDGAYYYFKNTTLVDGSLEPMMRFAVKLEEIV